MMRRRSVLEVLAAGAVTATVAGAAATAWRSTARGRTAEAAFPPEGQILTVAGQRVHAVVQGTGPDLVLIHGASGSSRDFTFAHMARLAPDFRVTAFDRPGLGHSDPLPGGAVDPAAQARLLAAAARQLGVVRPILAGHSYGGAVATAWALDDPSVAGLALLGGVAMPWEGGIWWAHEVIGGPAGLIAAPLVAAWMSDARIEAATANIFTPDPVPAGYIAHVGAELTLRTATLRANAAQVAGLKPFVAAMAARHASLTLPIEILHGTVDTIVPAAIHAIPLAQALPHARLTLFDGVGHMPHHARMTETLAALHRLRLQAAV
jgi:pimeloyl-ACP methyl ester carboxylesterase